jgi:hypothetical protein
MSLRLLRHITTIAELAAALGFHDELERSAVAF